MIALRPYNFRVEVSRDDSGYILDIEFFNYIYLQTNSSEGHNSKSLKFFASFYIVIKLFNCFKYSFLEHSPYKFSSQSDSQKLQIMCSKPLPSENYCILRDSAQLKICILVSNQ